MAEGIEEQQPAIRAFEKLGFERDLSLKFHRRTADKGIIGWSGVSQPQPDRGP